MNGIAHPGRHGAGYFQIFSGDRNAVFIIGKDNLSDTAAQIIQVLNDGENCHEFRRYGNVCLCLHSEPGHRPLAKANFHFSQCLTAEIQNKTP